MSIPEKYLQSLVDISQEINSIQDPHYLLEKTLDIAVKQLNAGRGFILLRDSDTRQLSPRAARNIDEETIHSISEISNTAVQKVITEKKPILTFDTLSDSQFDNSQSIVLHKISSIACVPLMLKGDLIGVIYIDSQEQQAGFNRQSLDFLSAFANQVAVAIQNARLMASLKEENQLLKEEFRRIYAFEEIIGQSPAMQQVFQMMGKVLDNNTTVLITGETGTGKELVARAIHYNGRRHQQPFIPVNCASIPENLLESELYGHKKGAFTGAIKDKPGMIEIANGGTLFLDEIGEIPFSQQAKLLRFLQEKEIKPVGGSQLKKVDVRVIAATNRDLAEEVREGRFREDLFYRLNIIPLQLPSLRERKKDIPLLARHFLQKHGENVGKDMQGYTPEALQKIIQYNWPGNVRELENTIERAVVLATHTLVHPDDILMREIQPGNGIEAGMTLDDVSKILLEKTLQAHDGNKTHTAETMGVSLRWVHYKTREWDIQ